MEAAPASNRTKAKTGRKQRSPITGPSSHEAPFAALRSVEEEEQFAEQQAELLTQRRTTRKKEELEARTMATLAEGGSWELQPSSGYDAIVAKLTEEIAREKAELASEWGSLDMVVGQAFAENHMSAKDIVLRWDKKFKGAISRVEFRNEVWETLGVQASRKLLDALFDEFDLDHGGTLDSDELHQALVKVQNTAKFLKKKETRLAHGQEVVGARLASVKAVALATAAAWDALVSDDAAVHSEVEPLMQRAVQLQKAWHAEDDKRRQREQAARDLIEAQRKAEEERVAAALAEAKSAEQKKLEEEKQRAELEQYVLEGSSSLIARLDELRLVVDTLHPKHDNTVRVHPSSPKHLLASSGLPHVSGACGFERRSSGDLPCGVVFEIAPR